MPQLSMPPKPRHIEREILIQKTIGTGVWIVCWLCASCGSLDADDVFRPRQDPSKDGGPDSADSGVESGSTGGSSGSGGNGTPAGGAGGGTSGTGGNGGTGGSAGTGGTGTEDCVPPWPWPCDRVAQCGCKGAQACYTANLAIGEVRCTNAGNVPVSSPCQFIDHCAPGTVCVYGGCKRYCTNDMDCPGYDSDSDSGPRCIQHMNGSSPIPGFKYCTDHCIPWDDTTCDVGLGCLPWSADGERNGTSICSEANDSKTTCTQGNPVCPKGHLCAGNTCRRLCRKEFHTDCPTGQTCLRVGVAGLFFENQEIGVCQ